MIRSVVVVGGGTAGWMSAAYLRACLGDRVAVTVVESNRVGTIGVGEATFSTIRHYFDSLGLSEQDWMPACAATYKLAIRFENWRAPGHHFYHPFERLRVVDGFELTDWWLHNGPTDRFDKDCFIAASLCDAQRAPRHLDGRLFEQDFMETGEQPQFRTTLADQGTQFPYAYQFDADLLAKYLRRYATERGAGHVVDDVVHVALDERGWIDHLVTREHGELKADLYLDCTGFRGLLLNQALGEPFQPFNRYLPNDRAVALRVPLDMARLGTKPYTTATAMDAGWIWTIPLHERIGTGYVYAEDYTTADEAERVLREFVGPAADGLSANHLRMRVGRSRNSWVNNCVAIGLSSGFVEPLESTGIFFIQHGIEQLVRRLPGADWNPALRTAYNTAVAHCIDGVLEFLALHYRGAARADNRYWRDAKTRELPGRLAERLDVWQTELPSPDTISPYYHGFEAYSYVCMILGLGGIPLRPLPALSYVDGAAARAEFTTVADHARNLVDKLPSQYEYCAHLRRPGTGEG